MKPTEYIESLTSANVQDKPVYSEILEKYEESAIWIAGNDEKGYFAAMGGRRISELYPTKQGIIDMLDGRDLTIILNACSLMIQTVLEEIGKEQAKELEKLMRRMQEEDGKPDNPNFDERQW